MYFVDVLKYILNRSNNCHALKCTYLVVLTNILNTKNILDYKFKSDVIQYK